MTLYTFDGTPDTAEDAILQADQLGYAADTGFAMGDGATPWPQLDTIALAAPPAAADITDATATGIALLTAANAAAARTATGAAPALTAAPSTASSTGTTGTIAYDATHIYVCIATNSWVRATLAAW